MATSSSYAIIESGGKQYRAEKGASLVVEHLRAGEGDKVTLRAVMYRGDKDVVLDGSELEKVKVEAVVAEHLRGPKTRIFKYKAKKGYRRRGGHRQELTRLEVTDVRMLTRKPAAKEAKPAAKAEAKPAAEPAAKPAEKAEAKPAEKKPATRKAPARKPPAKKPATAKAKPAAKKPAAKKAAARGKGGTARKSSSAGRRSSSAKKD
jgi:large subunit ribosomal protein L21